MGFTSYTCAKTNLPVLNSNSWGSMPETYEVVMLFKNGDRVSGCYDGYGRVEIEGGGLIESIHDALENKEAKLVLQKFCAPEDTSPDRVTSTARKRSGSGMTRGASRPTPRIARPRRLRIPKSPHNAQTTQTQNHEQDNVRHPRAGSLHTAARQLAEPKEDQVNKVTLPAAFLEEVVDTLNELADDAEDAGYPARATDARRKAERLRKAIVKATPTKQRKQ